MRNRMRNWRTNYTTNYFYAWERRGEELWMRFPFWPQEWGYMPNVSVNGLTQFNPDGLAVADPRVGAPSPADSMAR
jgi:hypothetical protein